MSLSVVRLLLLLSQTLLQHAVGLRLRYNMSDKLHWPGGGPAPTCRRLRDGLCGKIYFLMTAKDGIEWEKIWVRFLSPARPVSEYEVFVHCEDSAACARNIKRQDIFKIIPTVPSEYCDDLVSPMVALLAAAVKRSKDGNPDDKFVMVSHNSLPVKQFWHAHRILTRGQEGMAFFDAFDHLPCWAAKATQWFALSYSHAEKMLQAASGVKRFSKSMTRMPEDCVWVCTDESWPINTLYDQKELLEVHTANRVPKSLRIQQTMWLLWPNQVADNHRREDEDPVWWFSRSKAAPKPTPRNGTGVEPNRSSRHESVHAWKERPSAEEAEEGVRGREPAKEALRGVRGRFGPLLFSSVSLDFLTALHRDPNAVFMRKVNSETEFKGNLSMPEAWDQYVFKRVR